MPNLCPIRFAATLLLYADSVSTEQLARQALQKYFGFSAFRPGQEAIVQSLLAGKDTLAILPTGGGKSICFQVPALIFPGTTIVISPLISLMQDQVEHLAAKNIAATFINSQLSRAERQQRLTNLAAGQYKLLYLAPESLANPQLLEVCRQLSIPMLVVDEAHCVSVWGHQFRPSYLKIPQFLAKIKKNEKKIFTAAFTATATPRVKAEIIQYLHLQEPSVFQSSFLRENLIFHNLLCQSRFAKNLLLFKLLKQHHQQPAIIYCATRVTCQQLAQLLLRFNFALHKQLGIYHGGLAKAERQQVQQQFLSNELDLIIATNAFGMGVDKDNIGLVIHYQISASLENYYQEAGRAGRNDQLSYCYLLYFSPDLEIQASLINKSYSGEETDLTQTEHHRLRRQIEISKLQEIESYALNSHCLEAQIEQYFAQQSQHPGHCQHCANCLHSPLQLTEREEAIYQSLMAFNRHYFEQVDCQRPPLLLTSQQCEALAILQPTTRAELALMPGIGDFILNNQHISSHLFEIISQRC